LEEEEGEEEEQRKEQAKKAKYEKAEKRATKEKKSGRRGKGKGKAEQVEQVEVPPKPQVSRPRPKPKLRRTTRVEDGIDPTTTDTDGNGTGRETEDEDIMAVDMQAPPSSRRSPIMGESNSGADVASPLDDSQRRRITRSKSKSNIVDLCSSDSDETNSDSDNIEVVAAPRHGRSKANKDPSSDDHHKGDLNTPALVRSKRGPNDETADDTPRPRGSQPSTSGSSFFPLMAAQKRSKETSSRHVSRHSSMSASEQWNNQPSETGAEVDYEDNKGYDWLLDESSQSSSESAALRR